MPYLVVREKEKTYNVKLDIATELTIGRSPSNELCFENNITVSNQHALLFYNREKDAFVLRDLNSLNGTILNLNRISADIILAENDKIKIGDVRLLFKESSYNPSTKTRKVLKLARTKKPEDYDITATCVIPNLTTIKRKPVVKVFNSLGLDSGNTIGEYKIIKKLGNSRYGSVFMVKLHEGGKVFAAKMYNKAFDIHHPGIDEFYNSIGRMIQIKSPYFLKVLEPGNFQGHCYFVMEYMPEGDLNDIIARSAPFKEEDALSIIYTIADALKDTYNEHKIVHGELTPDNILIDSEYRLLLRGYGMSRWLHKYIHDKFVQGMIPWYTSPEQIEGKIPDWYSDLYSLGVIFFQLLTGYLPFQNESKEIVCNMHLNKRFPDPRNLNPNIAISDQTVMALKRMGAKSPRRRFSCWEEFIETLDMIAALTFDSEDNAEAITSEPVNPPRRQNVDNSLRSTFNSFFSSDEDEKAEDAGREES